MAWGRNFRNFLHSCPKPRTQDKLSMWWSSTNRPFYLHVKRNPLALMSVNCIACLLLCQHSESEDWADVSIGYTSLNWEREYKVRERSHSFCEIVRFENESIIGIKISTLQPQERWVKQRGCLNVEVGHTSLILHKWCVQQWGSKEFQVRDRSLTPYVNLFDFSGWKHHRDL